MKSAAQLIVDAAVRHLLTRLLHDLERFAIARASVRAKQELEGHRGRKFRRAAKAAVRRVERSSEAHKGRVELIKRQPSGVRFGDRDTPDLADDVIGR